MLTILLASLISNPGFSQDTGPEEFEKRLLEWRKIIIELRIAREEYYLAESYDESIEMRKKYDAIKESGNQKIREMKRAAAKAYQQKPRKGTIYHEFLINSLMFDVERTEDQEIAYLMAKALDTQPIARPDVARFAGLSFFIHSDFDKAKKHLDFGMSQSEDGMQEFKLRRDLISRLKPVWEQELKRREEDKKTKLPRAVFETTKGKFVVELFENDVPNTVKNFVKLAKSGFYDGLDVFLVLPLKFATTGSPNGELTGSPGYVLKNEALDPKNRRGNFRGTLCAPSLESDDSKVAGSIFMITFGPYGDANTNEYCNFGRVVEGMEVVDALNRTNSLKGEPLENPKIDKITSVTIENLRDHDYEPEVIRLGR